MDGCTATTRLILVDLASTIFSLPSSFFYLGGRAIILVISYSHPLISLRRGSATTPCLLLGWPHVCLLLGWLSGHPQFSLRRVVSATTYLFLVRSCGHSSFFSSSSSSFFFFFFFFFKGIFCRINNLCAHDWHMINFHPN
jgi:hypothetical protein